jgi:membrane protein DedA with SNARE-associated domain
MATLIEQLNNLLLGFEQWGYVIVFLIVLLECQAFFGLFMPGESMVMLAGFLAADDVFDLRLLIGLVALAAIMGDSIGYEFGRWLGRDWLRRHGPSFWLRPERLDRMDAFFARHGGWSVFFAHFLHVGRALMPFLAGAAHLPYLRFLTFNAIGCALWAAIYSLVGYYFGEHWRLVEHWLGRASVMTGIFLGLVIAMIWLWRWIGTRELEIHRWWAELADRRWILAFRRHFGWRIDWLLEKLSTPGYLALCLTIGIVLLFVLTALFRGPGGGLQHLFAAGDLQVARWFEHRAAAVVSLVAPKIASLGSIGWLTLVSLLTALILIWRAKVSGLLFLLLSGWIGSALAFVLEEIFARRRPPISETAFPQPGESWLFHLNLLVATIIYGAVAYLIVRGPLSWRWRALVVLLTILLLLILALNGLYLREYLLSDVIFIFLTGAAWVFLCIGTIETLVWRSRAATRRVTS